MHRILFIALLAACSPTTSAQPQPRECGGGCSSTDQCRNTATGCGVCFGGHCVSGLPAQPIADAGIDVR